MKCTSAPPSIADRSAADIAADLTRRRSGYLPEWRSAGDSDDPGLAIDAVMARYLEIQGQGLDAMPQRLQLEFLETLGANVLPAQPARAPLVFTLMPTASDDATVPQGTRVAAVLPPPPPSLASESAVTAVPAPEFYTEQEFTALRGKLAALYSIDPQSDLYADHLPTATSGFAIFDDMVPVPHRLYLGHGELFKLTASAQIVLSFDFATARGGGDATQRPLLLDWEYLSTDGWQPLILVDDATARFTRDGRITLSKFHGPDSKEDTIGGHQSCWIRATVSNRAPAARIGVDPAGYLLRFAEPEPKDRIVTDSSGNPIGYWLRFALKAGAKLPPPNATIQVAGVDATVIEASHDRIVTATLLSAAIPGSPIVLDGREIGKVLAGIPSRRVIAPAPRTGEGRFANLLAQREGTLILDAYCVVPGSGFASFDASGASNTADLVGSAQTAPAEFRIAVDGNRDILPGDVVTITGSLSAKVVQTDDSSLYVDRPLFGATPGGTVNLADALPPLRPDGADAAGALPQLDLIRARVGFGKSDLPLDSAYLDGARLDISKDFFPFGEQPVTYAAFYASCKDAFTRVGARVDVLLVFNQVGAPSQGSPAPTIVAEFFNGRRWQALGGNDAYVDDSAAMTRPLSGDPAFPKAKLSFNVPAGWVESEVSGEKQRWLRLRLAAGDYGRPMSVDAVKDPGDPSKYVIVSKPSSLTPPILARIAVDYTYFTNPKSPDFCIGENEFAFSEHSEDARWARRVFTPFVPVSDRAPALHFGFSSKPREALVSLLARVTAAAAEGDPQPYVWDYWGSRGWTELSVRDATAGLSATGLVQFVGAPDALPRDGLGGPLYRIRARLKPGLQSQNQVASFGGVWLNAVWGRQGRRIDRDGLGTSNGNPDQSFALPIVRSFKSAVGSAAAGVDPVAFTAAGFEQALDTPLAGVPILADEVVEVREWTGRGDDWQTAMTGVDAADIRFEVDAQDPTVKTAAWVRWRAQPHFYRSGPSDRHYVVERARGVFRFPGSGGCIPPAGAPIVVSYATGGGPDGNVAAGTVRELRSGVGFVQSVSNPFAAGGGASPELLRATRDRSAQGVRHRDRAVSREDYEYLAAGASAEVARARALALESPSGRGGRGCVGIVLVPHSNEAQPQPSDELGRTVLASLAVRVPAGVAGGLRILSPTYVAVGVKAEVLVFDAASAGRVEAVLRARLQSFLHPLRGGRDGRGWDFGQAVYLSDLALLIETTAGVDAVRSLQLLCGQTLYADCVPIDADQLVAAGDSQLKIIVPSVNHAPA